MQPTYKPGSVRHEGALVIYPVRMSPSVSQRLLPCALSFYPPPRTSRPDNAGIRELSTPGVHSTYVTTRLVGSYPTFSPLPMRPFRKTN